MHRLALPFLALGLVLAGCESDQQRITYVCEEPLEQYLEMARTNIASDYEVERSRQVLEICPEKDYHRRYTFSFDRGAVSSRQAVDARVDAAWCGDTATRSTDAELTNRPAALVFRFAYPWSTATGKYPQTEFRLDRSSMKGGFFENLDWQCRLEKQESAAG